jgi:UDP-N-acetylmuramoyl-tripeptide--D-alanyl-D-alanine ligase
VTLAGFSTDTRTLRPGEIFVALRTPKRDGHDFLPAARAAGAGGAIVARANPAVALPQLVVADPLAAFQSIARGHRRAFPGTVVAITGSAGKTSTKDLLALLLGGAPAVLATEGNLNNHIGVPLTLTRLDAATHTHAVIEAGISAPGEMETLAAMIEPDIAILTCVAPAHLEGLRDIETIRREKQILFQHLRPRGIALDGAAAATFAHTANHTTITLAGTGGDCRMPRVTDGMARNAILALRAALALGVAPEKLRARLARWRPAPLRAEIRLTPAGRLLHIDCYNANPASFADALETFHALAPENEPRLYVLGCMEELGPGADRHHRALGAALKLRARDELLITGGHAGAVAEAAVESGADASRITIFDTKDATDAAAARVAEFPGPVFVKGSRRHALERVLPGEGKEDAAWAS